MKIKVLSQVLTGAIAVFFAACALTPSVQNSTTDRDVAAQTDGGEYNVDPMVCVATHVPPATPNKSYKPSPYQVIRFRSYLSQKNIQNQPSGSFGHTLQIISEDAKTLEEANALAASGPTKNASYADFTSPLMIDSNGHVKEENMYSLDLQITSTSGTTSKGGVKTETLTGTDGGSSSYVSEYGYSTLDCKANVVAEPTRVIDTTNFCRRLAAETVVQKIGHEKNLTCTATARADYAHNKRNRFFIYARCPDKKGYSYTVDTLPSGTGCNVKNIAFKGTRNIIK